MTGWHYVRWQYVPGELRVWFTNRSHWDVEFVVTPRLTANCAAGMQKTFQLDGNKVYWSQTTNPMVDRYQQQAWRCVKSPSGRWMRLVALSPLPPTKLADVGLGKVAAAGRLHPQLGRHLARPGCAFTPGGAIRRRQALVLAGVTDEGVAGT